MDLDWTQGDLATGLAKYRAGEYFEAHEFWENVWRVAPQPEKTFLQALIQIAGAHHHLKRNNSRGAVLLMRNALRRLETYPDNFSNIAVATLRDQIHLSMRALEADHSARPSAVDIEPQG